MIERNSWERIRRQIKRLEETARNTDRNTLPRKFVQTPDHVICKANGNISALSGDAPGSGAAIIYDGSTTGSTLAVRGSSATITNLGGQIESGTYFLAHRTPGTQPVWVADTPQAPPSPTSPSVTGGMTAEYFPAVARINNTPQVISGTTYSTIKFQDSLQTYPTGSSAITYSTTLDEFRVRDPGLYHFSWNIPLNTTSIGSYFSGWVQLQEDGAVVAGTQQDATTLTLPEPRACSIYHPITSSTKAYRMRTYGDGGAGGTDGIIASGSTTGCARIDIRKVGVI